MVWNKGVSYGLFTTHTQEWLIGLSLAITAVLWIWAVPVGARLSAVAPWPGHRRRPGQCPGPRPAWGRCRFLSLPLSEGFSWYVFNLADVAIVAGVASAV